MTLVWLNHSGVATPSIADNVAYCREMMGAVRKPLPFSGGVGVGHVGAGVHSYLPHPPTPSPEGEGEQ